VNVHIRHAFSEGSRLPSVRVLNGPHITSECSGVKLGRQTREHTQHVHKARTYTHTHTHSKDIHSKDIHTKAVTRHTHVNIRIVGVYACTRGNIYTQTTSYMRVWQHGTVTHAASQRHVLSSRRHQKPHRSPKQYTPRTHMINSFANH